MFQRVVPTTIALAALWNVCLWNSQLKGAEPSAAAVAAPADNPPKPDAATGAAADPPGWQRLQPNGVIWVDKPGRRVVIDGRVCRKAGELEMFACLDQTKEHESIIALPTKAQTIHAALIAAGAEPGNPAQFLPEYKPARGTEIEITVQWTDAQGKQLEADARQWLRNVRTGKPLEQNWVFGGSGFWTDPKNGDRYYLAEDGDVICVSNFPSALLDLPIESPHANEALLFEAIAEKVPPVGTEVRLFLTPKPKPAEPADKAPAR